jgi:hypothetical protein
MTSRKCEQHVWNIEEGGWDYCNKLAVSWAKRMWCCKEEDSETYEAFCENHWSETVGRERVSSEEIDMLEVHES